MQVSSEDRPEKENTESTGTSGKQRQVFLAIAALVILIGGYFLFFYKTGEEAPVIEPPVVEAPAVQEPDLTPTPETEIPQRVFEEKQPEWNLPELAESDPFVRERVKEKSAQLGNAPEIDLWLQPENLLQRGATLVDGLSKGVLLKKVLPVAPPSKPFSAIKANDSLWMDMSGYRRYDRYTQVFTQMKPEATAGLFHTFRPLLEEAFGQLGHDGENLDTALIKGIDLMLETPEIEGPIELVRESVQYKYADSELEALPPLQKQLLRMGPENTRKIKAHLRKIREALLKS